MTETRETKEIALANIPAFPAVVLRVLDLVSQDEPDFHLLVREISSDATLSAQVLRLANSARFGFAAQIGTVQHAVMALGTSEVQSLVMSVAIANYSRAALRTGAMQKCWRHTVASAVLCREVARAADMPAEQAYSLGLLHDIGRLGLLVAWPEDYNRILMEAERDSLSLLELEKHRFTMDHCEVGRRLVEQWKLPPDFQLVAGRHHDPPAGMKDLDQTGIAYFGCQLADALGYWVARPMKERSLEDILTEMPRTVRDRFPGDADALRELIERSVSGGHEILNQSQPESIQVPRVPPVPAAEATPDSEDGDVVAEVESRPIVWDFVIVLASVLTFVAVIVALRYFQH